MRPAFARGRILPLCVASQRGINKPKRYKTVKFERYLFGQYGADDAPAERVVASKHEPVETAPTTASYTRLTGHGSPTWPAFPSGIEEVMLRRGHG